MIDENTVPNTATQESIDWEHTAGTWKDRAELAEASVQDLEIRIQELETENAALRQGKSKAPETRKLSSYQLGEQVEVVALGEWFPGVVNGVEHKLHLVYVHTERGPVTVASDRGIRPLPKN